MDGEPRDVRTSPESPAQWPGELSEPMLSLISPFHPPFFLNLAGNGRSAPVPPTFF